MSTQQRLEGPDLEGLLAKVRADFGGAATIVEANKLRKGGLGGFFAKESFEVVVDLDATPATSAEGEDDAEEIFVPFTIEDLVGRVDDPIPDFSSMLGAAVAEASAPAPEPEAEWPAQTAIAEVAPVVDASVKVARLVAGGLDGVGPAATTAAAPAAARVAVTVAPAPVSSPANADLEALAALGVPLERLALPLRTDEPTAVALVRLLQRLPMAPAMPTSRGSVVAVVGDRQRATEVAAALLPGAEIVVASRRRGSDLRSAEEADERRRAWRRRKTPTLVVVDAPFGIGGDPWAADVLGALEPVVAMGHVDAARKPEDVRAWAEQLGGLDALAVDGVDLTTTPAAVLSVGLPVALVDGKSATPARWAAILTDRMAALAAA